MSEECVFCRILAGQLPASFVLRGERVAAFMDIQPVNPGHVLVIPLRHAASLAELDADDAAEMMRAARRVAAALRESGLRCEGVNLFLADGEAAGQEVFHAHLHVFPRWSRDGFGLRFGPDYRTLPPRAALDDAAEAIRGAIK
ncbi:MAG TPA: HIT family protein [Longimicrobium sp.]|nr:HIT family protein [Longimicrobium sp.]